MQIKKCHGSRFTHREDGAALVELAIVAPLVVFIAFGILEFGLLFNHSTDVNHAARLAARTGVSTMGLEATDDFYILRSLRNDNSLMNGGTIQRVVVFKADTSGAMAGPCKQGIATSGECNVYSGAQMQSASLGALNEAAWAPSSRAVGTDYLGVQVVAKNNWITPMFSTTNVVQSAVAMQLQPGFAVDSSIPGLGAPAPPTTPAAPAAPAPALAAPAPPAPSPVTQPKQPPKPATTTTTAPTYSVPTPQPQPPVVRATTTTSPAPKPPVVTTTTAKPKPVTTTTAAPKPVTTTTAAPKIQTPPTTATPSLNGGTGGKNAINPGF